MKRLLEGRVRSYNLEKRYIRPNRSIVWVNLTVVAAWVWERPQSSILDWWKILPIANGRRKNSEWALPSLRK